MIMPGVQKPHWRPCFSQNACCRGWSAVAGRRPSIVVTLPPSAWTASIVQLFTALAVDVDGAGAALARVAADVGAGELEFLADQLDEQASGLDVRLPLLTVDRERNMLGHQWSLLPLFGRWVAPGLRMRRGRCRRTAVKTSNAGTDASAVQARLW